MLSLQGYHENVHSGAHTRAIWLLLEPYKRKTMETTFSVRLLLEPYKCKWKTFTNAASFIPRQTGLLIVGHNIGIDSIQSHTHVGVRLNTSTIALRVVGGDKKESLESETVKYGRESHGTRIRIWMCWWGPAAIANDRPILSSERMLYKDYDRRCSVEKKKCSGHESQGARRQDKLIGGKLSVIK
jgi:hypothetical protein